MKNDKTIKIAKNDFRKVNSKLKLITKLSVDLNVKFMK